LERGTEVTVIAFGGKRLRRRVWEDVGEGVGFAKRKNINVRYGSMTKRIAQVFQKKTL